MKRVLLQTLWLCVCACTHAEVISGPSDAGTDASMASDMAVAIDHGRPVEPPGGGECDQQDDCNACSQCAVSPSSGCNWYWTECNDSPECLALIDCADACTTQECFDGCGASHPSAIDMVNSFYTCIICDECSADCVAGHATWCETPPL